MPRLFGAKNSCSEEPVDEYENFIAIFRMKAVGAKEGVPFKITICCIPFQRLHEFMRREIIHLVLQSYSKADLAVSVS